MDDHAEVFQCLAEPTRLRLLNILMQAGEICVCELVQALRLPQYGVSRHLQKLVGAGLLQARRQGKWIYYRINGGLRPYQRALLRAVAQLGPERKDFDEDLERASRRLKLRRDGICCVGLTMPGGRQRRTLKWGQPGADEKII
jgi:ArsR family transcriptional regulator, arsenate/arsenite/antimonite-responsive transcriptional repressor